MPKTGKKKSRRSLTTCNSEKSPNFFFILFLLNVKFDCIRQCRSRSSCLLSQNVFDVLTHSQMTLILDWSKFKQHADNILTQYQITKFKLVLIETNCRQHFNVHLTHSNTITPFNAPEK